MCLTGQEVQISQPLAAVEGQNIEFTCSILDSEFLGAESLATMFNGLLTTERFTAGTTTSTQKMFTFGPTERSDNGSTIQCSISDIKSDSESINIYCKLI